VMTQDWCIIMTVGLNDRKDNNNTESRGEALDHCHSDKM
jgi:hypothetical protein